MWSQIQSNQRKSLFYSLLMGFVLAATGCAFGIILIPGIEGVTVGCFAALVVWLFLMLVSYFSGDKILLASSGARKIMHDDFPQLFNVVEEMKIASGLPKMPEVYIIEDRIPNAFATGKGPERCAVAVTTGLLERLSRDELQGVIAHEISHIVNRDVKLMATLGVTLGAIVLLSESMTRNRYVLYGRRRSGGSGGNGQAQAIMLAASLIFIILAPALAQLIYFAVSRKREFLADACGVQYSRYPEGLASALEKISTVQGGMETANKVTAPMYIVNPFSRFNSASGLMSTHPPTRERVNILRGMAGGMSLAAYQKSFIENSKNGKMIFSSADLNTRLYKGSPSAAGFVPAQGLGEKLSAPLEFGVPIAVDVKAAPRTAADNAPVTTKGEISDFLHKSDDYKIIYCTCGLKIKIPPTYAKEHIFCSRCGIKYLLNK